MTLATLSAEIRSCRACPRLVAWREEVGRVKRRAYQAEIYWGRPVTGFGDPRAKLIVVGLAPGAHGANRTGRIFTGDGSGDFLYAGLFRAGLANQPLSTHRDDGLKLRGVWITCPVRCVPPQNAPSAEEVRRCAPFFSRELALLRPRVIFALGHLAWNSVLTHLDCARPRPRFGHGAHCERQDVHVVGSFHVSRQNTQTGRLTPRMFDDALKTAVSLLDDAPRKHR